MLLFRLVCLFVYASMCLLLCLFYVVIVVILVVAAAVVSLLCFVFEATTISCKTLYRIDGRISLSKVSDDMV